MLTFIDSETTINDGYSLKPRHAIRDWFVLIDEYWNVTEFSDGEFGSILDKAEFLDCVKIHCHIMTFACLMGDII